MIDLKRGAALAAALVLGVFTLRPLAGQTPLPIPPASECQHRFEARAYAEAQACSEALLAVHPGDVEAMGWLGRALLERQRPRAASEWLERAVALAPERSDLHNWLAKSYGIAAERAPLVRQLGLARKAGKEFERAVLLDPANLDAVEDLIEFEIEAPPFLGGSLAQAQAHAAALERHDRLRGRLARVRILQRSQGLAAAEREWLAVAAEYPADPRPLLALGAALGAAGRYDRALTTLDAALRLAPDDRDVAAELAHVTALAAQHGRASTVAGTAPSPVRGGMR